MTILLSDFEYDLPAEAIAQHPLAERDGSRMLLLHRQAGSYEDHSFAQLPSLLKGNELVIINNARVIPARLFGRRAGVHAEGKEKNTPASSGFLSSQIEVLLTRRIEADLWEALVRPGRKIRTGERLIFEAGLEAEVVDRGAYGLRQLKFSGPRDPLALIERIGHMPLPPYIRRADEPGDRERYQTVFAQQPGAVAAPTAGLHFTPEVLRQVGARGVEIRDITLDVGLGTFQPIRTDDVDAHQMHTEAYLVPEETAMAIAAARGAGRPVLAIGTTVVRALEDAAEKGAALGMAPGAVPSGRGAANIFIRPGHHFAVVDQLLTNFHLPRSTLLLLVAAFAGREPVLSAYRHAVEAGYRFFSYGDCMLIR